MPASTLYAEIEETIAAEIARGEYRPGDQLPAGSKEPGPLGRDMDCRCAPIDPPELSMDVTQDHWRSRREMHLY